MTDTDSGGRGLYREPTTTLQFRETEWFRDSGNDERGGSDEH